MPHAVSKSRARQSKPRLSLEWIVDETIRIVRTEGLEKATMRRVAQALETGPASLYAYVANTSELHAAVTDTLIADVRAPDDGTWIERLEALLGAYRDVLFEHPGLARSALALRPMGQNMLRLVDSILALMIEGGVPAEQAAWGSDLLITQVTGSAAEHSDGERGDPTSGSEGERGSIADAVRAADPSTLPHVATHRAALLSGPPQARMSWSIRAMIAGIASTPISGR